MEEEDVSGSVPQSWAKFSKNNVEESQSKQFLENFKKCRPFIFNVFFAASGRSATRQLRYDVNNLINNAARQLHKLPTLHIYTFMYIYIFVLNMAMKHLRQLHKLPTLYIYTFIYTYIHSP